MERTLTCLPRAFCSSDFRVTGLPEGEALVQFDHMTEQGHVSIGGHRLRVRKHGMASGRWTLEHDGAVLVEGHKPRALRRGFEIRTPDGTALDGTVRLRPAGLGRAFVLEHEDRRLGEIGPKHAFTRRARITCDPSVDSLTVLLAFWLAALSWRRDAAAMASSE